MGGAVVQRVGLVGRAVFQRLGGWVGWWAELLFKGLGWWVGLF